MRYQSDMEPKITREQVLHDLNDLDYGQVGNNGRNEWSAKATAAGAALWEISKTTYEHLEDRAVAGARVTDRAIRSNPYQSLGVALGAGVVIGILLHRR